MMARVSSMQPPGCGLLLAACAMLVHGLAVGSTVPQLVSVMCLPCHAMPCLLPCLAMPTCAPCRTVHDSCHPTAHLGAAGRFDGEEARHYQSPWMHGMYVGQLDSEQVRFNGLRGGAVHWMMHGRGCDPCLLRLVSCPACVPRVLQPGHVYTGWSPNRDPKSKW